MTGTTDALVRCSTCNDEQRVNFAYCLRNGWPTCHGQTMTLIDHTADIDKAVNEATAVKTLGMILREARP